MKNFAFIFLALASALLFSMSSCSQKVTGVVQPGYEWHDTDHLKDGTLTYNIRFHRSGFDSRDMGKFIQTLSVRGDTVTLIRNTERAGTQAMDTLLMTYPELKPISFSSIQGDRKNHYKVRESEIRGMVIYPDIETLEYTRSFDKPFFDIAALGLVLGGVNHESLEGHHIKFFDSESNEFTRFEVEKVEREQIEGLDGNSYNCNVFRGNVNQAGTSVWIERRSGKLIKTHAEMQARMAVEMLIK